MQPIERYGVIALLSLVVIIAAVVMWDQAEAAPIVHAGNGDVVAANEAANDRAAANRITYQSSQQQPKPKPETALPIKQPEFEAKAWGQPETNERTLLMERLAQAERELEQQAAEKALKAPTNELAGGLLEPKGEREVPEQPREQKAKKEIASPARTYVVKSGDTLGQIAVDQLGSYKHLAALQASNPKVTASGMRVGARLELPDVGSAPVQGSSVAKAESKPSGTKATGYQVSEGDSLWGIAEQQLGSGLRWKEIVALNPKLNPDALVKGQHIKLPKAGSKPAATTASRGKSTAQASAPKKGVVL